jgi:N-acetylneuraminate lyase
MSVAERWTRLASEDFPVIIHVGANAVGDACTLARHAAENRASAIALAPPSYHKPADVNSLVAFIAHVAAAAPDTALYYYHIPSRTGVDICLRDLFTVAAETIPTLVGAKFTDEDLMDFNRCVQLDGGRFDMLFGRDEFLLAGLALGARGAVGTTYNFAPGLYLQIIDAFEKRDMHAARRCQQLADEMIAVMERYGGMRASKAMVRLAGLDCGPARTPERSFSPEELASLRAELESIGFFNYCLKVKA